MVDAIAPSPAPDPALQFSQALAASNAPNAALQADAANNASFLAAISNTDAEIQANTTSQSGFSDIDGLLALDTPSLSLLNEFSTDPRSAAISGNLTTQQLQDIAVLQEDTLRLQEAATLTSAAPLTGDAATVDLSADAVGLASGALLPSQVAAAATLSSEQLQRFGAILAPYANEPLTQPLFLQLQASVAAAGFSPLQFNLRTLFLALQYVATLLPATAANSNVSAKTALKTGEVAPVAEVDAVEGVSEHPGELQKIA